MKISLVPRSLFWRLVLVWLACFALLQGISFCDATRRSDQFFYRVFVDTEARLIALQTRMFIDKTPDVRAVLAEELSRKDRLEISLAATPSLPEQPDATFALLSSQLKNTLVTGLAAYNIQPDGIRAEVKILRQRTAEEKAEEKSEELRQAPFDSPLSPLRIRTGVLRATFRLPDGQWLSISHCVEALPNTAFHFGLSRFAGELLLMVALALATVFWIVRPLRHLARATENFGSDLNTAPLPENKGSIEVRDASRAFNSMRGRIRTFVQERAQLLGAVSHDLRTPLTRIRLRLEGVQDESLRAHLRKDVEDVLRSLDLALSLARSMNASDVPEALDRIDLTALLESLADDRQDMGQDVRVTASFPEPVRLPPVRVRRCLDNLVDNAVRYGGGSVEIAADLLPCPPQLSGGSVAAPSLWKRYFGLRKSGEKTQAPGQKQEAASQPARRRICVRIRVFDKGPGIPEAELEHVFMPFFRLEPSRNPKTGGHGLGLAIARNLARHSGGDLTLANRPEGGLCATLILVGESDA